MVLELQLTDGQHTIVLEKSGYKTETIVGTVSASGFACTSGCAHVTPLTGGIQVTLEQELQVVNVCTWVVAKGGVSAVTFSDLMTLVNMYLGTVSSSWPVKFSDLMAGVYYYLGMTSQGNTYSGCSVS